MHCFLTLSLTCREPQWTRDTGRASDSCAYELYIPTIPCAHEIVKSAGDPSCPLHLSPPRPTEELVAVSETDTRVWEVLRAERRPLVRVPETGNEDLIEILLAE